MNYEIIQNYIAQYKERFDEISEMEIYKWIAVKQFQDNWNIEAADFAEMLKRSLAKTQNLLASGYSYPRRMVNTFASEDPETVREHFKTLFNENLSLEERFDSFKIGFEDLAKKYTKEGKENHYQDPRALMVYLSLKFPEEHFFYKYEMFNEFTELINYGYKPKQGRFANLIQFERMCGELKGILIKDDQLLKLHHDRLGSDCYQDPTNNILTQDFIYACVRHLRPSVIPDEIDVEVNFEKGNFEDYNVVDSNPILKGSFTNHELQQRKNSILGRAGEDFVLDHEKKKLEELGIKRINKKLKHSSVEEGDGLGYDIKSADEEGNEILIEVKATSGGFATPFYITRNELYCSQQHPEKYRLYRLYDFDAKKKTGKIKVFSGDLSKFCIQAVNYQVALIVKEPETV